MFRRFRRALALGALGLAACQPFADTQDFTREDVPVYQRSELIPPPDPGATPRLRVIAWNVKYGAGRIPFWFDCWGDRTQMSEAEVQANMQKLYDLLNEMDPDILMTEEIEVNSKRSAYVDMVRGILEHTKLNYAAYIETWNSRYVPSEGVGRINLGNAMFSKFPISKAERIRQQDRTDQDPVTSNFYIHRAVGRMEVTLPQKKVAAYVVHTEAYDNDGTKQAQIKQIHELVQKESLPFVLGGDFNELPPNALRLKGFPDERESAVCSSDFTQPPYTPQVMQPFFDEFVPSIALDRYGTTEESHARYFTHSVLGPDDRNDKGEPGNWNRTLDYLFIRKADAWVPGSTDVLQHKGQTVGSGDGSATPLGPTLVADPVYLSDHAPVTGLWEVK